MKPYLRLVDSLKRLLSQLVPSTGMERVVVVLIVASTVVALVALLVPGVQYAWDGDRVLPVLIEVFDATSGQPIVGARVTILEDRFLTAGDTESRTVVDVDIHEWESPKWLSYRIEHGTTDSDGRVRLEHKFNASGSSNGRTKSSWIFLSKARVCVTAPGYGGILVPVRHESARGEDCYKNGKPHDVYVTIGLFPQQAHVAGKVRPDVVPGEKPEPSGAH